MSRFFDLAVRVTPFEKAVIYGEGGITFFIKSEEFGWIYNDDGPIDPELEALAYSVHAQIFNPPS